MRKLFCLLIILSCHFLTAQQVAVTIDDFPFRIMGLPEDEESMLTKQLYDHLDEFNIEATGFLNAGRINSENEGGLKDFLERGHDFGNHTYRHSNADQVGAQRFIRDIDLGWTKGKDFINTNYFRYPYLRRGSSLERRDSIYAHLKKKNFSIAHVSIDNNEWIYNRDYVKARINGQKEAMDSIARVYLEHMKEVSLAYEKKGVELTGRSVKHILLIHANPINAEYLGELLQWYKDQGWKFITLGEALEDPIYSLEDDFVSPHGWSQIDRLKKIAKDQVSGQDGK